MPINHQENSGSVGDHPVPGKVPGVKDQENVHVPECLVWDTDSKPELYRYVREVDPRTGKEVVRRERYHPRPFNRPAELGKPRQFVPEEQRSEFNYRTRREESSVAEAMRWWPDGNKAQNQKNDEKKNKKDGNRNGGSGSNGGEHHHHLARSSSTSSCSCSSSTSSEDMNQRSHHGQTSHSKQRDEQKNTRRATKQQQQHHRSDKSNKSPRRIIRDTKSNILRTEYITNVKTPSEIIYDENALKDIKRKSRSKSKNKVNRNQELNQERENRETNLRNEEIRLKEQQERAYAIDNRPIHPMVGDYYTLY